MGIYAIYLWSINTSQKNIGVLTGLGHDKITDMRRSFRNACVEFFIRNTFSLVVLALYAKLMKACVFTSKNIIWEECPNIKSGFLG